MWHGGSGRSRLGDQTSAHQLCAICATMHVHVHLCILIALLLALCHCKSSHISRSSALQRLAAAEQLTKLLASKQAALRDVRVLQWIIQAAQLLLAGRPDGAGSTPLDAAAAQVACNVVQFAAQAGIAVHCASPNQPGHASHGHEKLATERSRSSSPGSPVACRTDSPHKMARQSQVVSDASASAQGAHNGQAPSTHHAPFLDAQQLTHSTTPGKLRCLHHAQSRPCHRSALPRRTAMHRRKQSHQTQAASQH